MGLLDKENMKFNIAFKNKIGSYAEAHANEAKEVFEEQYTNLYRDHPVQEDFDKDTIMSRVLNNTELMKYFD